MGTRDTEGSTFSHPTGLPWVEAAEPNLYSQLSPSHPSPPHTDQELAQHSREQVPEREASELTNGSRTDSQRQPERGHKARSALPSERNTGRAEKARPPEAGSRDTHAPTSGGQWLKANEWSEAGLEISLLRLTPLSLWSAPPLCPTSQGKAGTLGP